MRYQKQWQESKRGTKQYQKQRHKIRVRENKTKQNQRRLKDKFDFGSI